MSDRLTDEQVARVANLRHPQYGDAQAFVLLAREVQELRAVVDAIDKLHYPVDWHGQGTYCHLCPAAWPCETHRLLHPEEEER